MSHRERKKKYLTYGTVISFMLDYTKSNDYTQITYDPKNMIGNITERTKIDNYFDFLTSRSFLFSHGVFNEYCYFYQFKNRQDARKNYLNTAFLVLPAFELDSADDLNKLIKKIKRSGISVSSELDIDQEQIIGNYIRFKQEVQTNHDKSLKLMKEENNTVHYNDYVLFLHLKSGKFLEYKYNNKNFKTYVQLTNNISKRTIFRFLPAYDYQSETSTHCLFDLAMQIACGERNVIKEKYIVNDKIKGEKNSYLNNSFNREKGNLPVKEFEKIEGVKKEKKSIFDADNMKKTIQNIYNEEPQDSKIIDEFTAYAMNENIQQKNFGVKLMPEDNYVVVDSNSFSFWRIINFSENFLEDVNYLNFFDFFCIQNPGINLFIDLKEINDEEQNTSFLLDKTNIISKSKNEFPIKEEKEDLKSDNNSVSKNENKSNIINTKENNNFISLNKDFEYINNKNNINDTTIEFIDNKIEINYLLDSHTYSNKQYELIVDTYKDKEHLKPYSLFKIEPSFECFENIDLNNNQVSNLNIILEDKNVRLINVFTNKVLCAVKKGNNQYSLILVNDMGKEEKYYENTIFTIKQIKDIKETEEDVIKNDSGNEIEDKDDESSENREKNYFNLRIKKKSYIKLFSEKYKIFIGIRIKNEDNNKEITLTNSMCDITKFQLNCLDEEDKYELNFFEQLLLSFKNILNYFKFENKTVSIISQNYERIRHILLNFKNKLNQFQNSNYRDVNNLNLQENKFDFIEILHHFNIVSKLIELFLTNWFKDYNILSYCDLEDIIKKYFEENNDILKYKLLISREILNIMTIIYDLNPSYLNVIEENLIYFFIFVGRDDHCTKFLVHIIKDNKLLLNSLCPLSKESIEIKEDPLENKENINENNSITNIIDNEERIKRKNNFKKYKFYYLKKCLIRIIKDYNNISLDQLRINFSSLSLFFNLFYNLLIFDNKPFEQFYDDYFKDLGLLKEIQNGIMKPNFEQNPMLIDFYVDNSNEIYIKKISFYDKENKDPRRLIDIKLNDLIDIISNYNYETEEDRNDILLAKLVSLVLFFYSFLSLCDTEFKSYMVSIFQFDNLINNYFKNTYNVFEKAYFNDINDKNKEGKDNIIINENKIKVENPLMNDLKCSIIQVLTYLYLKAPYPFMIKTHLFKIINTEKIPEITSVNKTELKKLINFIDNYVLNNKEKKFEIKNIDQYCFIQILELIKFTLRNLYLMKNNLEEEDRDNIYNLVTKMVNLVEKFLGLSEKKDDIKIDNDKILLLNSIQEIINYKLELRDPILLVSENIQYMFLKYKNKLEEVIKKKNERGNNTKSFLDILSDICDKEKIEKNKYDRAKAELTKKNIKLLRRYNLKGVLMEVSINTNRNNENLSKIILLTMEEILQEFIDYLEFANIEGLDDDLKLDENISREEYEYILKNEIINKKCSTKYLDEFKRKRIIPNEFRIIPYFFKLNNTKIQNMALDILYKLNSGKKIFYFIVKNLVIMKDQEEYTKFIEIKNIFINLIQKMKNLNLIQRLDQNSILLCNDLNNNIQLLLDKTLDRNNWENDYLKKEEDLESEDSILIQKEHETSIIYSNQVSKIEEEDYKESANLSDKEEDKKDNSKNNKNDIKNINSIVKANNISDNQINNKSKILSFDSKESGDIIDSSSKDKDKEKSKQNKLKALKTKDIYSSKSDDEYFINDKESLAIYQQTIYNLGFISFINNFFAYIDKLSEIISELTCDLLCLEEALISIYKLLVVFIIDNENNQSIIKNRLYLYICPLKIKKISSPLLKSLNEFLFNLVCNFKSKEDYGKISHIDKVVDRLYLLHKLDWNKHKDIMPNFVRTLLIFFDYSTPEHIYLIFQLLDDIKNIVTTDILNGDASNNNRFLLTKLLEFIENEQSKKENRIRPLLSMTNIIKTFPILIDLLFKSLKFAKPLVLITNFLFDYNDSYYKKDFDSIKNIILNSLLSFCRKFNIRDEFIFKNTNRHMQLKYFNEFLGLSLPKLYILLDYSGVKESSMMEILEMVNEFHKKIYDYLVGKENKEDKEDKEIFLEEKHIEEINSIMIIEDLLSFLRDIIEIKYNFENSSTSSLIHKTNLEKNELTIKSQNLTTFSLKKSIFNNKLSKKEFVNVNDKINDEFKKIAEDEIDKERKNYTIKLFNFFQSINKNDSIQFFVDYCQKFTKLFENNLIKNHLFFFYWTNIFLMQLNQKEQNDKFYDDSKYNKDYFNDLSLIEFTIERFENINLNINNYENLLYIKFLNSYLNDLDEENTEKFLTIMIEKPESTKLFHLIHNILDNLFSEIKNDFKENNNKVNYLFNKCPASAFEKNIEEYEIILNFLVNLSQNNDIINNKMKDYLRLQYNNIKNHNFIIILSNILSNLLESYIIVKNRNFISKYYLIIIKIIEFITNCCYGTSKENQKCVVMETNILYYTKNILKYLNYREKKYDENGKNLEDNEEKEKIDENGNNKYISFDENFDEQKKLSYLKYKLLVLLNALTIGREKEDKIFDIIHQTIDFDVLKSVLIETYKEILIENNAQDTPDDFTFEENMLSRMNDLSLYLKRDEKSFDEHFIIFEIGTYAYILINTYLENLNRPLDSDTFNSILEEKKNLRKHKCEVKSKSIFKNLIGFWNNLLSTIIYVLSKWGNCFEKKNNREDFSLKDSFNHAYKFYFEYTPNIEILYDNEIYKYYIRLSPICKCLTREMKDEFHSNLDRSSAKTKTENLFKNVEFFRYQLIMNKKILDAFKNAPILNLFFNHYKFYRDVFLIMAIILNLLIFMSYFRIPNKKPYQFDYGFLYNHSIKTKNKTKIVFAVFTIIELVFSVLILVNYLIFRVSYFLYYKESGQETEEKGEEKYEDKTKMLSNLAKNGEILKYVFERLGNVLLNIIKDIKLIYHLILLAVIIITLITSKYKILSILLIDIIERSSTLMCIVKSFWLPKTQIIAILLLFYLVAYYFIILIYLFIPDDLPGKDCLKFSNCYFTLCDQTIKNSNGIINYLTEDGLYTYPSLWVNPRFWIDNWFAIFDLILVIQMFCGIIIDTFLSQKEDNKKIEKDKNNACFICDLKKNELNKLYSGELGYLEHIKLDHYLWNYMFAIFNVTIDVKSNLPFLDNVIKKGYENKNYSMWVPYKKCLNKLEKDSNFKWKDE